MEVLELCWALGEMGKNLGRVELVDDVVLIVDLVYSASLLQFPQQFEMLEFEVFVGCSQVLN